MPSWPSRDTATGRWPSRPGPCRAVAVDGVVVANELLDNLPFDIVRRSVDGRRRGAARRSRPDRRVRAGRRGGRPVGGGRDPRRDHHRAPGCPTRRRRSQWVGSALLGAALRAPRRARLRDRRRRPRVTPTISVGSGPSVVTTVGGIHSTTPGPRTSPPTSPSTSCGADSPVSEVTTQAEFLRAHGIDALVDEGRRVWNERAHLGDLEAHPWPQSGGRGRGVARPRRAGRLPRAALGRRLTGPRSAAGRLDDARRR